jgi:hypothetical protein
MSNPLLYIDELKIEDAPFQTYLVASTAPINVEQGVDEKRNVDPQHYLQKMTQYLKDHQADAEILVLIHGYNTDEGGAKWCYERGCQYLRDHYRNQIPQGLLVIGYRWPSEKFTADESGTLMNKIGYSFLSLPVMISLLWWSSLVLSPMLGFSGGIVRSLMFLTIPVLLAIATLLLLRISNYFRDTFRANNYGVPDFVEFIRQLDAALIDEVADSHSQGAQYWQQRRIRLSFIGHSMGAFVVTNAVRILSDVFDKNSIGRLDSLSKTPSPDIGNAFTLGRLVLVAPDIPADTIISGRANTLRSSLRRFEEAYLFSNRGDTVLKLASTAANYFTFPAKSRDGGHRLGNVSVSDALIRQRLGKGRKKQFGIVNFETTCSQRLDEVSYLDYLCVRKHKPLSIRQREISEGGRSIAELFTYFDCSDYTEVVKGKEVGIVSYAFGKPTKNPFEYITRIFNTGSVDTHGGFIYNQNADVSKRLIYGLACLGFKGVLNTLEPDSSQSFQANLKQLEAMSRLCEDRGIQVLLASERYEVDVICGKRDRDGY